MNGMSSVAHISVAVLIVETLPLVMGTFSCDAVYVLLVNASYVCTQL